MSVDICDTVLLIISFLMVRVAKLLPQFTGWVLKFLLFLHKIDVDA